MTISGNEARQNRNTPGAEPNASSLSVSPLSIPFKKGDLLAQKYRVESLIGIGGIGFVIAATHVELGERLALKFLRPEFVTHPEAVRRFASEARHAARIRSEHVARVYDVGSLPDGAPFIVMEYLEGTDLHRLLHREGPLPIERAVGFVVEACAALAAAHACYIVHRDIKPDNLFLARQPHGIEIVKVLDFGISKAELDATLHEDAARSAKQTVGALGSPSYMAPEQIRAAADVDARADIWSLGCVLYELLTMHYAFDAPSVMQVCAAVLETEPVPLASHRADVPAELEAVVMRCLEKDPARRYQDLAQLVVALAPFSPPRARASIEKTVETVGNIRPYSADDAPPSSRVVRSRPTNDRPPPDESAVRALPQEIDAEWDAIASDRDPFSLRAPGLLLDEVTTSGRLARLAPPKASASKRVDDLAFFSAKATLAGAGAAAAANEKGEPSTETASGAPALDPPDSGLSSPAENEEENEPTRVFAKPLRSAATAPAAEPVAQALKQDETALPAPAAVTRPRRPGTMDATPSIIIQDFPSLPAVGPESDPNWAKRSLAPLWIALALAVFGIVVVEWRVWWPSPEAPSKRAAPSRPNPTTKVVENDPVPPAPQAEAAPRNDLPVASSKERPALPNTRRVIRRRAAANEAARARTRAADVPKIEAIADEVELASEEEPRARPETPAEAAPTQTPEPEGERKQVPFGAIVPPGSAESSRASASASSPAKVTAHVAAPFPTSAVEHVVREHASEIQGCYDRAAMEHPDLHGRITMRAVVDETGSVASASTSSIEDGARLSACIAERVRHWQFPAPPSGSKSPISYTFVFE
jgi:serine/threonine-protein kinase